MEPPSLSRLSRSLPLLWRVPKLRLLLSTVQSLEMKFSVLDPTLPFSETLVPVSSTSLTRVTGYVAYTFLALSGVGLRVYQESNVIIRNLVISEVLAEAGDAIGIQEATKVWIDHLDLSSNLDHDKD